MKTIEGAVERLTLAMGYANAGLCVVHVEDLAVLLIELATTKREEEDWKLQATNRLVTTNN